MHAHTCSHEGCARSHTVAPLLGTETSAFPELCTSAYLLATTTTKALRAVIGVLLALNITVQGAEGGWLSKTVNMMSCHRVREQLTCSTRCALCRLSAKHKTN